MNFNLNIEHSHASISIPITTVHSSFECIPRVWISDNNYSIALEFGMSIGLKAKTASMEFYLGYSNSIAVILLLGHPFNLSKRSSLWLKMVSKPPSLSLSRLFEWLGTTSERYCELLLNMISSIKLDRIFTTFWLLLIDHTVAFSDTYDELKAHKHFIPVLVSVRPFQTCLRERSREENTNKAIG